MSRAFPGILWTHNDSGHPPDLFAITFAGQLVAHFQLPGAEMVDWEDLALAPCPATLSQNQTCIYIADTGDNFQHRRKVQLYVLPEPNPWNPRTGYTDPPVRVDFSYPDGPVDVEALAVDPRGVAWLFTKGRGGPVTVYSLDLGKLPTHGFGKTVRAVRDGALDIPNTPLTGWVTGAALSPSGERLIVRTYVDIYSYNRRVGRWTPSTPGCHIGAIEPQGEAIDFVDDHTFVLTSEALLNRPGTIHRVQCP